MKTWIVAGAMLSVMGGTAWAQCPVADVKTVCIEVTEGKAQTGQTLKQTVVTGTKNGAALTPIIVPPTGASGGGLALTTLNTTPCVSEAYTFAAYHEWSTQLGVFQSLSISSTPGSLVKDRRTEPSCFAGPSGFSVR